MQKGWTPSDRPLDIRMLNAAGRCLNGIGVQPFRLDEDSLVDHARRKTGLSDFGGFSFEEGLRVLCRSLESECDLTPVGRWLTRLELRNHLINRLLVVDTIKRHPEIREQQIVEPIFITGTGRSGTSILHEVLAQDSLNNRALLHWEVLRPCPPPDPATHASDPRIREADHHVHRWEHIAPPYKQMHEGGGAVPQEDDFLFNFSILSDHMIGLYGVPSFQKWLFQQDRAPAWEMHKSVLQILQWKFPKRRWVLKSPTHLMNLPQLFRTYPDARVIMTHRDPLKVVASQSSLRCALFWMRTDTIEPVRFGHEMEQALAYMLDVAIKTRDSGIVPESQITDVKFQDFMRDPVATIRKAYQDLGLDLPDDAAERMSAYVAAKPRDRGHGRHRYRLEDFGLDPTAVSQTFAAYRERFDVPTETE